MDDEYDVTIAYRIYPKVSKVPPIYGDNKFKLSEFCLKSFKGSLGSIKAKMLVILDDCGEEYEQLFKKYFSIDDLIFYKVDGIGNQATFAMQIQLLLDQSYSSLVYFAEDDYFYKSPFEEMIEFIKNNSDVDFVTPYDHLDYYTFDLHKGKYEAKHWRTAASTCLTFLTKKKTLEQTKNIFLSYSKGNHDCSIWHCLTKYKIRNPVVILKSLISSRFQSFLLFQGWRYCGGQLLFGRKWKLWVPIPTIATHMESNFLAPSMDMEFFKAIELS
jgi:hypothetical protein